MKEDKFCAVCGKQLEKFWVGGQVKDKDVLFCGDCGCEILMKKQWILEDENQALKDRWEKLKDWFQNKDFDHCTSRDRALAKMQELEKGENK